IGCSLRDAADIDVQQVLRCQPRIGAVERDLDISQGAFGDLEMRQAFGQNDDGAGGGEEQPVITTLCKPLEFAVKVRQVVRWEKLKTGVIDEFRPQRVKRLGRCVRFFGGAGQGNAVSRQGTLTLRLDLSLHGLALLLWEQMPDDYRIPAAREQVVSMIASRCCGPVLPE